MGEKAVITDRDTHHRRAEVEEEHTELEPINSEMIEIDGSANEGDESGADEETGGNPVHTVKGNAEHSVFKFMDTGVGCYLGSHLRSRVSR